MPYGDDSPPKAPKRTKSGAKVRKDPKATRNVSVKKEKINVVSKASLAMLNPRHAMGMEATSEWCSSPTGRCSNEWDDHQQPTAPVPTWSDDHNATWTASPTPTLEAFTMESPRNEVVEAQEEAQWPQFSSVFEDENELGAIDRAAENTSPQRPKAFRQASEEQLETPYFYTREGRSGKHKPSKLTFVTPASANATKPLGSAKSTSSTPSAFSRFFSWKRGGKAGSNPLASRSTSDLHDIVPSSAPPTMTTFNFNNASDTAEPTGHSTAWRALDLDLNDSSSHSVPVSPTGPMPPHSAPSAPELYRSASDEPSGTLLRKHSMPTLHDARGPQPTLREARNARSIVMAEPPFPPPDEPVPALPPLPASISAPSPIIPSARLWNGEFSFSDDALPLQLSSPSIGGRVVSSLGRGVPTPSRTRRGTAGESIYEPADSPRRAPLVLQPDSTAWARQRSEAQSLRSPPVDSAFQPLSPSQVFTLNRNVERLASLAKRDKSASESHSFDEIMARQVVQGMLRMSHEEPAPRSAKSPVAKTLRRRSRSVGSFAPMSFSTGPLSGPSGSAASFGLSSPELPGSPAFGRGKPVKPTVVVRTTGAGRGRAASRTEASTSSTPTQRSVATFHEAHVQANEDHKARSSEGTPKLAQFANGDGETHQARRVNLKQRARAVAVASPNLVTRSPRTGQPPLVVNVMPPTPDLGGLANEEANFPGAAPSPTFADQAREVSPLAKDEQESSHSNTRASLEEEQQSAPQRAVLRHWKRRDTCIIADDLLYSPPDFDYDENPLPFESPESKMQLSRERVASTASTLSDVSSGSSASSATGGPFGFSSSLSSLSLSSSSTGSSPSQSPVRARHADLPNEDSRMGFGVLASSTSLSSAISSTTTSSSILDVSKHSLSGWDAPNERGAENASMGRAQLRTPFHFQSSAPGADSSELDTPKLSSASHVGAARKSSPQLDIDLGIDIAAGLGLGLGFGLAGEGDRAMEAGKGAADEPLKRTSPPKPPKSKARATTRTARAAPVAQRLPSTPPKAISAVANPAASALGLGLGLDLGEERYGQYQAHVTRNEYDYYSNNDEQHDPRTCAESYDKIAPEPYEFAMGVAI